MAIRYSGNVTDAVCLVGLQKDATTAYVMRDCAQGLRSAKCLAELYGGALQCHCQFDFCNDGRAERSVGRTAAAGHRSAVSAIDLTLLVTAFSSSVLQFYGQLSPSQEKKQQP